MSALYWVSGCLLGYALAIAPEHVNEPWILLIIPSALALFAAVICEFESK